MASNGVMSIVFLFRVHPCDRWSIPKKFDHGMRGDSTEHNQRNWASREARRSQQGTCIQVFQLKFTPSSPRPDAEFAEGFESG